MPIVIVIGFLLLTSTIYAQDQETRLDNPITRKQLLELGYPTVVRSVMPAYPPIAVARRISGPVMVDVDINPQGNVSAVRVVIGEKLLRSSARKAALRWRFKVGDTASLRSVRLTFVFLNVDYVAPKDKPAATSPYRVEIEHAATR